MKVEAVGIGCRTVPVPPVGRVPVNGDWSVVSAPVTARQWPVTGRQWPVTARQWPVTGAAVTEGGRLGDRCLAVPTPSPADWSGALTQPAGLWKTGMEDGLIQV